MASPPLSGGPPAFDLDYYQSSPPSSQLRRKPLPLANANPDYYPPSPFSDDDKHASIPTPVHKSPSPSVDEDSYISVPRNTNRYAFHQGPSSSTGPLTGARLWPFSEINRWRVVVMAYP
jgi:hypothetical protein